MEDSYLTVAAPAEYAFKEKGSKFLAYAFHIDGESDVRPILDELRKRYYDATHHCYAWRTGAEGEAFRSNDDGEPSGTAGRPILGQLLSKNVTDTLVVVVRYFGGTKLGVPGLIAAYKESAAGVLAEATIEERLVEEHIRIAFPYVAMNEVMRVVKECRPRIVEQCFDNLCTMTLAIRLREAAALRARFDKAEGVAFQED